MAIIKQGILGGFKKKIGSVVGSSWKGKATMRSLPLSVANPKTAAQVSNRNRFKACAEFASLILASIIKPLMDRFAGQMSGYNYFTKLNKEVFANPSTPTWYDLIISKGKMIAPVVSNSSLSTTGVTLNWSGTPQDRYGLPTDKVFALIVATDDNKIIFQGDTGATRSENSKAITFTESVAEDDGLAAFVAFLRADGSEVSNSGYLGMTVP